MACLAPPFEPLSAAAFADGFDAGALPAPPPPPPTAAGALGGLTSGGFLISLSILSLSASRLKSLN